MQDSGEPSLAYLDWLRYAHGRMPVYKLRLEMQRTMQSYVSVVRNQTLLEEGKAKILECYRIFDDIKVSNITDPSCSR